MHVAQIEKLEAARRTLAAAEAGVGVRTRLTREHGHMAGSLAVAAQPHTLVPDVQVDPERAFEVSAPLAPLFPAGLRRGSVVQVVGGPSVMVSLAAVAVGRGRWCAVVDLPDLGLAAAADLGIPLERTVVVPRSGPDGAVVLGAVVDGVDVVVLGATALADRERRTITSRVRTGGGVLLTTNQWPGADVRIEVSPRRWHGIGTGSGVLRAGELAITAHHRHGDAAITVHAVRAGAGWCTPG